MTKNALIIIIAAVLAVAVITVCVVFIPDWNGEENNDDNVVLPSGGVVYDPNQGEYDPNKPQYNGSGASEGVAIPGFGTWTIPPKVTKVNTDFFNPSSNADKYDLTFEVWIPKDVNDLSKGYEVIYKSGLIKAGNHIQEVTLSRGFEKGEYDAILHVQPYTVGETQTALNNANIKFKLIVT